MEKTSEENTRWRDTASDYPRVDFSKAEYAEISGACRNKLREFERELNKQGCWNVALVAYQLKD